MTPEQATDVFVQHDIISTVEAEQQRRDQDLRAYRVLGELMQRVPVGVRMGGWEVNGGSIRVHLGGYGLSDHEIRGRVMLLAEQFDLDYTECPLAARPAQNRVSASGDYQGVQVTFLRLVAPCSCEDCGAVQ